MTTLSTLRERITRILSDPTGQQYPSDLLDDGIVAALEAILPWTFKQSTALLEADYDNDVVSFELPDDLYRITAVFDADSGIYIPQNTMSAGMSTGEDLTSNQDWMEYPEGFLSLANAPEEDVILNYGAVWDVPSTDDDEIEAPTWCHRALVFYTCSYSLLEKASSASNIRQWNVAVDSGTPAMNPMRDMSSYFFDRFVMEMERMPQKVRGVRG